MFKLRCERHYRNIAGVQHDVNTSRKRCRRDADIRQAAAAARRSVTIDDGGVRKMSDYYSFSGPRRDGRLSWSGWLIYSGHFTHEVVTCQL